MKWAPAIVVAALLIGAVHAKRKPENAPAASCDERLQQAESLGRTYEPRATQVEWAVATAKVCASAIEVEADPERRTSLRARLARAQILAGCWADAADTLEAMVAASPDDPRVVGAYAAALDRTGRPGEAEAILARAEERGAGFGRSARFEYVRERFDVSESDRIQPMIDALKFEETDRDRVMLLDLINQALVDRGSRLVLSFLSVVESGRFDRADLQRTWAAIAGLPAKGRNPWMGTIALTDPDGVERPAKEKGPLLEITDEMRKRRQPGRADAIVRIETDGSVRTVWVLRATDPLTEEAAVKAVMKARYIPAKRNGEPIPYPLYSRFDVRFN